MIVCVCVKTTHPNPKGTWEAKSFTQSRRKTVPHLSSALAESEDRATVRVLAIASSSSQNTQATLMHRCLSFSFFICICSRSNDNL